MQTADSGLCKFALLVCSMVMLYTTSGSKRATFIDCADPVLTFMACSCNLPQDIYISWSVILAIFVQFISSPLIQKIYIIRFQTLSKLVIHNTENYAAYTCNIFDPYILYIFEVVQQHACNNCMKYYCVYLLAKQLGMVYIFTTAKLSVMVGFSFSPGLGKVR